jgi:GPH family glycoside/pentoside/hexuronide:cation symporter
MEQEKLPLKGQLIYAAGSLGWSVIVNVVAGMLIYFYQPIADPALENLLPKIILLGFLPLLTMILLGTRLMDAVIDPVIAYFSDKSGHKKGRRVPFMLYSVVPVIFFGFLLYMPLQKTESYDNAWWLVTVLMCFNIAVSFYVIPYNALLPELGHTSEEKLRISTFQSIAYSLGLILAASANSFVEIYENIFHVREKFRAYQYAIWTIMFLGWIFLLIPPLFLNERKYSIAKPIKEPILKSFTEVMKNRNLFLYLFSDFTYFISITLIGSGAQYYVKALLKIDERHGTGMVATMIILAMVFSPFVYMLARKISKKTLVLAALFVLSFMFLFVFYLGNLGLDNVSEAYIIGVVLAFPVAFLGILPPVILAELTHYDSYITKQNKEATYFGIRSFFIQVGQTLGVVVFTILIGLLPNQGLGKWLSTMFPNIPFDELGIRLSGVFGFILCLLAALIFAFFRYGKLMKGIKEMEG